MMYNKIMSDVYQTQGVNNSQSTPTPSPLQSVQQTSPSIATSFKNKWKSLPRKTKFVFTFTPFLFLAFVVIYKSTVKENVKKDVIDLMSRESASWEKLVIAQRQPPLFTLSTSSERKFGILPDEKLVLQTKEQVDKKFIEDNLDSSVPVVVKSVGSNTYEIRPASNVGLDQIVDLRLNVGGKENSNTVFDRDYSWVFQTQEKFRVVSSIPGDEKVNVPVNTGIELVFSQDDYKDSKNYVAISPSVDFRTERHGVSLAVVPIEPLKEKTIYTVTLRKGLNLESRDDPITSDHEFSFQTMEKQQKKSSFSLDENFHQITPEEKFQAKVFTANWNNENRIKTDVYRFTSPEEFIRSRDKIDEIQSNWMNYYSETDKVDVRGLDKVMSVDLEVRNTDGVSHIQFPDSLPKGFYIIEMAYGDEGQVEQLWVQSTSLTGYVSVGKEQTVVWANQSGDGPAGSAEVRLVDSGEESRTSDNGVAIFGTPRDLFGEKRRYVSIISGDDRVYLKVSSQKDKSGPSEATPEDFWSYFYHDRKLYKPTDKIDFFGVVKNRSNNSPPSSLIVEFHKGYYYSWRNTDEDSEVMFSKAIVPSSDGSFIGSFSFEDLPKDSYYIKVIADGVEILSDGLSVTDFEKPEIKIEVVGNKKAIFTDESVEFVTTTRFFDDTPVANTPVSIHESSGGDSKEVDTDGNGQVRYLYETKYKDDQSYYPRYEYVTVKPAISQEVNVEGHGSAYVFGSRIMISSESDRDGNKAKFVATVNNVDLSGINSGETSEYKGSPVEGQEVKLNLKKNWYEKIEKGTYYDFIEKVTRKTYDYKYHSEEVESKTLKTDSTGEIIYEFDMEDSKSYELQALTQDRDGHLAETKRYYYSYGFKQSNSETKDHPKLSIDKEENTFSKGERVNMLVELGEESYPDNDKNRFLFITAKDGSQEVVVNDTPRHSFDFEQKHIPNVYLGAVVYTGEYYSRVATRCSHDWYCTYRLNDDDYFNGFNILYNKEDSGVDLTIDSSQSSNEPGGRAKVIVKASQNGQPLVDASINLAMVDQALAAIGGVVEPSILSSLYQSMPHFIYYNYGSHEPIFPEEAQAEMGGGGGDRDLFKDSAYFGLTKTDGNGIAEFEFDLPDNITTWIVYVQAIDSQINAGWEEGKLTVTKDFFVTSQFPSQYLTIEKAVLTGGSYGMALNESDSVDFESLFYNGDIELGKSLKTASAYRSVNFDFPQLSIGKYNAVLRGRVKDKEDGIRLPFEVLDSRFSFENYSRTTLDKGDSQTSAGVTSALENKPVTIVISDQGKGVYYRVLKNYCYSSSNRLEKQLAGIAASDILESSFGEECERVYEGITLFQADDGGLSQVNWGGSNLETTAWAVNLDPQPFDTEALTEYFETVLSNPNSGTKDQVFASWGLTELGKPQIVRLDSLRQKATGFEEKVILGIAFASIGDIEKALDLYYDILANYAYQSKPYIRMQDTGEEEHTNNIVSTSHALLLGEMTDKTYNDGLGKYVRDFRERAEHLVIDLSEIAFLGEQISTLPDEDTQVHFKSSNVEETRDLVKGRSVTYKMLPRDINNFYLEVINGKAESYISYFVGADGFGELSQDDKLKISRTIKKVKGDGGDLKAGDIVEVRIDFDVDRDVSPPGRYVITDYLPSGLKYISNPYLFGLESEEWVSHDDQVIEYSFYNSPWWRTRGKKYLIYFARAGSVGTYTAESAVIQSQNELKIFKATLEEVIEISGSNN